MNEIEEQPDQSKNRCIIRGLGFDYQKDKEKSLILCEPHIWVQQNYTEFVKIELKIGNSLQFHLGKAICKSCYQETELDDGYCNVCYEITEFRKCIFYLPDSFIGQGIDCNKKKPACDDNKNAKRCHSNHGLYLGRIGNLIKVGTTRIQRKGTYVTRFLEQGLNEVIIVHGFKSLEDVLMAEMWFIEECLFPDRLTFDAKIINLTDTPINLKDIYLDLISELYQDHKIEHFHCFKDKHLDSFETINPITAFDGKIIHIQGPILIIENNNGVFVIDLRMMMHREVLKINHDVLGGGFW